MAEETLDIPVTLEGRHERSNSTRNLGIPSSGAKVLPHYLRASTGSCHDFCKYGAKHVFETKGRSPMPKRTTTTPGEGLDLAKTDLVQRKNRTVIIPKPLPDSKSQTPNKQQVVKKEIPALAKKVAVSSKQVSSPGEGIDVTARHPSDGKAKPLLRKSSSLPNSGLSTRRYSEIIMTKGLRTLKMSPVGGSSSRRYSNINTSKEVGTSTMGKKNDLVPLTVSLSPKPSVWRVLSTKSGNNKNAEKVSHLKNRNSVKRAETEQSSDEKVPEKTLYVIESKPENLTVELTQNGSHTTHSSPSPSPSSSSEVKSLGYDLNGLHTSRSPPSSGNKNLRHTRNGIYTTRSSSSSSLSSENRSLRLTRNGTHNTRSSSSSLSLLSSSSESLQTDESGPISERNRTKTEIQIANQKVEHKSRPNRVGRVSSEDKDCSSRKLNFRRGKLVDVQSENNGPRRLRFRQGKVLGENQNGKADNKRRSLRRVVVDGESNDTKTESVKVVLRHQDVEGKKGVQSLFNNVIEETASKLVETRKGKVKALVGAFETVISLQDTKSSATTSAQ